jgi:hypothetical protein
MEKFFKRKKKQLPTIGTCFISNGECYKILPSMSDNNNTITITDKTCEKETVSQDQFHTQYDNNYSIIDRDTFDKNADEFIKEQLMLLLDDKLQAKLLIERLKQCCPEWFEKKYSNIKY